MNRRPFIVIGLAILAFMVLISAWAWIQLPADAQVPIHFGIGGTPNRYAGKTVGLFLLPAIAAVELAVLLVIPRVEPRSSHLARSGPAYTAVAVAATGLLAIIHLSTVANALGSGINVVQPVLIGVGVLFLVVGNYLGKIRSNFLFGVRTPWTLTSELAWARTHRLGGRLFALLGAIIVVGAFVLPPGSSTALLIGGVLLVAAVLVVYSYVVWSADPDRRPGP